MKVAILEAGHIYEFSMCRSYSRRETLPTNDLLEAIKISLNYEAELYVGNVLLASWMGLPMETNIEKLEKEGIEVYVVEGQYCFQYKDSSRNNKRIYYTLYTNDTNHGELQLSDTPSRKNDKYYSSLEEIYIFISKEQPNLCTLTVVDFSGDTYKGSFKFDLKQMKPIE